MMRSNLIIFTYIVLNILIFIGLINNTCWFHHSSENSFSEVFSVLFYFITLTFSFINYKKNKFWSLFFMLSSFVFMMEEINWGLNFIYWDYYILLENDINQFGIHFLLYDWIGFLTVEYFIFKLLVLIYLIILPLILSYKNKQLIYLITFIPLAISIYLAGIRSFFIELNPNSMFETCSSSSGAELAEFQFALTICFFCIYFFSKSER